MLQYRWLELPESWVWLQQQFLFNCCLLQTATQITFNVLFEAHFIYLLTSTIYELPWVTPQTITNLHASKQAIDCSSEEQGVSNIVEWSKIATIFLFSINGCNNFCLEQSIPIFRCLDLCPSFYQTYLLGLEDPSDDWRTTSLIHTSLQKWIRLEMCGPSSNIEYWFVNLSRFVLFPFLTLQ